MWDKNKDEVIADHNPHSGYTCSNCFIFLDISHGQGACSFFISIRRWNYFKHEKKKMEPIKHLLNLLCTLIHSFHKYLWGAWSVRVIKVGRPYLEMQQQTIRHNPTVVEFPGQTTLRSNRGNSRICGWSSRLLGIWLFGGGAMIPCDFMSFVRQLGE